MRHQDLGITRSWVTRPSCFGELLSVQNHTPKSGRKKAHKHKLFSLVNVQMALGQTAGCPSNRAKKFMCSPRNTGNTGINFSLWLTGGLSQGCPDFQKVYVFKVYVPFCCPTKSRELHESMSEKLICNHAVTESILWHKNITCSPFNFLCVIGAGHYMQQF